MGAKEGQLALSEVEKLTSVARSVIAGPNSVRPEGEYFVAAEPNAFGIPSVETCPGRTEYCESKCYAIGSERRDATAIKLKRNLNILENAESVEGMAEELRKLVDAYKKRADKLGIPEGKRRFRIHWSGDFYSVEYAEAWRIVMEENPNIKFFVFTRSFQEDVNVLPALSGTENLDLFLSVDWQNVHRAKEVIDDYPDARVAYLVEHLNEADELIEIMGRSKQAGFRHRACPENMRDEDGNRKLEIISAKGGACSRCTYCIDKSEKWDVVFVDQGSEHNGQFTFSDPVRAEIKLKPKRIISEAEVKAGAIETAVEIIAKPVGEAALVGAAQESLF